MAATILTPVLVLAAWTLVMWFWMYVTRLPAMQRAGINPAKLRESSELAVLPRRVRQVADNYNHLHEQPVVFYALAIYSHLVGVETALTIGAAWAYVGLRIAHSLWQATVNFIPVRFALFAAATAALVVIAGANLLALIR